MNLIIENKKLRIIDEPNNEYYCRYRIQRYCRDLDGEYFWSNIEDDNSFDKITKLYVRHTYRIFSI